jgi:hypothetical protein
VVSPIVFYVPFIRNRHVPWLHGCIHEYLFVCVDLTRMATDLASLLLTQVSEESHHGSAKVTVVGTGQVGMAAAFAMVTQVKAHV